ncbi:Archaellum protein F, flagellin of FlaG/FlaF family [Halanaeroarchaeum sp. HSR-CO]|uniref:flagellin n=1 Tax=Halanaeroarchaeum sp. HSR-CO TaxID=2866382 RepID=UPI00217EF230|nr:flagellin [Halanaeroarchaeum sp. HSR-CO]UWG48020.1 Archaellum protein F, flagellin of FlaG/FlaF family [Halanaeroarchaeum sp. HSR-CO]
MGFSVSASTAILLVAAFASVGMLYTSAANGFEQVSDATLTQQEQALETENTDVSIVNITHNTSGTTDYVNVTVENAGASTLHVSKTDLLLNGTYTNGFESRTLSTADGTIEAGTNGTDLWQPGENLTLVVHENVSKPFRVKVVSDRGVAATEVVS